jgi:small-conductance mechanosensitive channel
MRVLLIQAAMLLSVLLSNSAAQAQTQSLAAPSADAVMSVPSPNDTKEFLRLLSDPGIQNWIRDTAAEAGSAAAEQSVPLRERVDGRLAQIAERAQSLALAWSIFPQMPVMISQVWNAELSHAQKVRSLTYILTFLLIGFGLEWLYRQFMRPVLLRVEQAPKDAPVEKLSGAVLRFGIVFAGLGVFAIGSIGAFKSFEWHPLVQSLVLDFLGMVLLFRIVIAVSRFFQAPYAPELRLVPYGSSVARYIHRLVGVLGFAIVLALALAVMLSRVAEMSDLQTGRSLNAVVLAQSVALAFAVVLVTWGCIWAAFRQVPQLCEDTTVTPAHVFWRNYLIVLVGLVFLLWLFGVFGIMWTVLILGLVLPVWKLLSSWIDHFFDQSTDALQDQYRAEAQATLDAFDAAQGDDDTTHSVPLPDVPEFADPYATARPIVQRAARFALLMCAVLFLSMAWGVNILDLSADRSILGRVLEVLIDSLVALLLADLVWTWAKSVIDKRLAEYEPPVDGQAPGPEARMITLLPLLRTILMVALLIMVALSVLSAAGVNIAPILAGAGVLGIAIGFGTQSLVRDVVAGIFFLVDDAFRLGEYIEVGDLMGTVESISVRSMRIRHHRGKVHTIPYGELKSLTNHSRDWVIMKLEFRVPFDTDLQLVKKLIKKVGEELAANEHYGPSILSTLKSQGVRRMEEFNMVVGVKFMTKPGEQWLVRRDAYQKVRDIFEANGIRMAERNVKVEIDGGDHLSGEQRAAIAGAAQDAAQGPSGPPKPVPDEP